MTCKNCPLSWVDEGAKCPTCHADPDWPAPCEYDDEDLYYVYDKGD